VSHPTAASAGSKDEIAREGKPAVDTHRHSGRVVPVTGAGSGIGRAAAIRFAEEGGRVATDVVAEGLGDTLKAVVDAGHDAEAVRADVTVQADVDRMVAEVGGRIDVLVNNAGTMDHFVPVTELDDTAWDRVVAVNLTGAMRLRRALSPPMREADRGVVNVASIGGLSGAVAGTAYVASKHGVIGLTRSVAAPVRRRRRTLQRGVPRRCGDQHRRERRADGRVGVSPSGEVVH
jgi:NAD(P)-dependent dehydrogenase (short-subunit alcohol dehydrogenase family)